MKKTELMKRKRTTLIIRIMIFTLISFGIYILITGTYTYSFAYILGFGISIGIFFLTLIERKILKEIIRELDENEETEQKKKTIVIHNIIMGLCFSIVAFFVSFYSIREIYIRFFWRCG